MALPHAISMIENFIENQNSLTWDHSYQNNEILCSTASYKNEVFDEDIQISNVVTIDRRVSRKTSEDIYPLIKTRHISFDAAYIGLLTGPFRHHESQAIKRLKNIKNILLKTNRQRLSRVFEADMSFQDTASLLLAITSAWGSESAIWMQAPYENNLPVILWEDGPKSDFPYEKITEWASKKLKNMLVYKEDLMIQTGKIDATLAARSENFQHEASPLEIMRLLDKVPRDLLP